MRDVAVTLLVLIGLFYTFKRAYAGILLWSWLGYMNPHRLCYGFAYSMPFAQITAIVTVISIFFSKDEKKLPKDGLVYLLLFFIFWMGITTAFAFNKDAALEQYIKVLKIQFPIILTLLLFNTKDRIHQLIWVIILSLGYFSIKGGAFTLMTGGSFLVYGPPSSFVEENNALAVATLMIMPLFVYMRNQLTEKWQRNLMLLALILMGFSVLGSKSRGAFLAISLVGIYFWMHSNSKLASGILIALFVMIAAPFLPESWYERMNTIETYNEDESAMGRIRAWTLAFNVANHNILGGGMNLWGPSTYSQYLSGFDPLTMKAFVAHSIYFSVLGEHGWIGLFLFLLIFYITWSYCGQLVKYCKFREDIRWIADLAMMIKISLLAYLSGGAFLSLSYFDLPWHLVSIVILLKVIMGKHKLQPQYAPGNEKVNDDLIEPKRKFYINPQGFIR